MVPLADLVAESHAPWTSPVAASILGSNEPAVVAAVLTSAVSSALGAAVNCRFYELGVDIVVGVDLDDGRAVVAKLHRQGYLSREWLVNIVGVERAKPPGGGPRRSTDRRPPSGDHNQLGCQRRPTRPPRTVRLTRG